jgi:hypothetical protein
MRPGAFSVSLDQRETGSSRIENLRMARECDVEAALHV